VIKRILLAVDDSPAALAAATLAVDLARALGAELRVLHVVVVDGALTELIRPFARADVETRRDSAGEALLAHVAQLADAAGVTADPVLMLGEPARCVLDQTRTWPADLVVLGRSHPHGTGAPYIGQETQRVLEFCDRPVLVIPA
jgi:nucleotide-binding universal stress UspA family protein